MFSTTLQKMLLPPHTGLTSCYRDFVTSDDDFCHSVSSTLFDITTARTVSIFGDLKVELNLYLNLGLLQSYIVIYVLYIYVHILYMFIYSSYIVIYELVLRTSFKNKVPIIGSNFLNYCFHIFVMIERNKPVHDELKRQN